MTTLDRAGRSELHYAAERDDVTVVRRLLAAGEDPSLADTSGWTALHFAAQGQAPAAMRLLLAAGADPNAADQHGNTPLFRATFTSQGEGECIGLLREHGADPHRRNAHGVSPLGLAQSIANYPVAQFFSDVRGSGDPAA